MTNLDMVVNFLTAYQRHDAQGMVACLDPQVEFSDVAFPSIRGEDVRAMWSWFCQPFGKRPKAIEVPEFKILDSAGDRVVAQYRTRYAPTPGRDVDYVIRSEFTFRDGRIARQVDTPTISKFEVARMATGFRLAALALPWVMRRKLDAFKAQVGTGAKAAYSGN